VLLPDPSIDVGALALLLAAEFDAGKLTPTFVPAGGDSWCYRAGPWWVSVRRDRQGHFPANYEAARELRDGGHEFVVAPLRGRSGQVIQSLGGRPVVITDFIDGTTHFPEGVPPAQLRDLSRAMDELHGARVEADVRSESFDLPFTAELDDGLARASVGERAGPLAGDVAALVRRNEQRIREWRAEIEACQGRARAGSGGMVLTHGEPDPPNVIVTPGGELLLLDWGDLLRAPPERDARVLRSIGIDAPGRPDTMRFYELRWILSEVAEYVARFTHPHSGNAEDLEKRRELARYLT
jgi:spectinomycin phosphotransferase